jgi:hypothetical protein
MVSPSSLAVLRLMTSSYLSACWDGQVAKFGTLKDAVLKTHLSPF